jgi:hypothetical protein
MTLNLQNEEHDKDRQNVGKNCKPMKLLVSVNWPGSRDCGSFIFLGTCLLNGITVTSTSEVHMTEGGITADRKIKSTR